jgi:hypothetical protein
MKILTYAFYTHSDLNNHSHRKSIGSELIKKCGKY